MSSFRFSFLTFRSLSARLTFWVMLTVMIVTVIIALIVSYISSSAVLMGTKENVQSRMEIANQHINSVLVGVEVAVANTIPEVENSLSNPDKMYGVVRRLLELNPNIIGSTVAFEPNYYPSKGKQFEQMMTTYSRPLFDASGNIYAIITADVSLEWLTELVTESDLDFNQRVLNIKDQERDAQWAILEGDSAFFYHHAYTYIIGKGGAYITHPLRDRILNESYFILSEVTADTIDDRIGYEMIDGKTGMEAVDRDGTKFYINYAPIERTGWSMATVIPAKLIFTRSMIFGGIVVAVMLIGLAILFFICHHILIRVTKPLTLFAKSADEVAQGNLNASLPQILSHDEMKRLHDSFAMMQTSLKEQMEELKQVNETKGRIEGELNAAKDIQMSMLPKLFPAYPDRDDIDIYGQLTSAKEVGGDLFDFFIRDDKLFFCIGDVSGKGIPASLVMAMTRSLFRNIANHESRPEKIVSLINEAMSDGNDSNMFVTFFLGVLDLQTGQLHYCNAGHDWPYLVGNGITELKSDPNLPVGTFSDTVYCLEEYQMPEGTILFMYTDGLTEAQDSQRNLFGDQRIVDVLQTGGSCKEIIAKMTEAVHKFVGDAEQSDDLTMLAIQYKSTTKQ